LEQIKRNALLLVLLREHRHQLIFRPHGPFLQLLIAVVQQTHELRLPRAVQANKREELALGPAIRAPLAAFNGVRRSTGVIIISMR